MNILISIGEFSRNGNATTAIAHTLAQEFLRDGRCTVCGNSNFEDDVTNGESDGVPLVGFKLLYKEYWALQGAFARSGVSLRTKLLFSLAHPYMGARLLWYSRPGARLRAYQKALRTQLESERYDAVLCTIAPTALCKAVTDTAASLDAPVIVLQLDPWGLHRLLDSSKADERIAQELKMFEDAVHVFTTPVLYSMYAADARYAPYLQKITALEFPNIRRPQHGEQAVGAGVFDEEAVNILYCGTLDDSYRSPEYVINVVKALRQKGLNVRVLFMNGDSSAVAREGADVCPQGVVLIPNQSVRSARGYMQTADILLNLGNAIDNMVPSKLFDYISTGKPVVSVEKIANSPALPYLERYPNAIVLFEADSVKESADRLEEFLAARHDDLPFERVEEIFYDCTPEYVADKLREGVESAIHEMGARKKRARGGGL